MPTPYTRSLRRQSRRNRRQLLWSILALLIGYAIVWFNNHHQATPAGQSVRDSIASADTTQFLAERSVGDPTIHVALGVPTDATPDNDVLLRRTQYVLSYNPTTRCANWVAWNQSAWWYGSAPRYRGQFLPDPLLPPEFQPVLHRDYVGSGFDRGHLVRSEERTRSASDNRTTFYTTNILPQYHALNAGPWLRLEEYVEHLCKQNSRELFIIAGPIYHDTSRTTIGRGVRVPAECFKIIVVLPKGRAKESVTSNTPVIAVRMPNLPDITGSWEQFATTVSDIERATGYRFFTALPDYVARALKEQRLQTGVLSF
ncbi:MAG: hypothetical protein KatS3mg039_1130 [Candidatus Kapaibacterium sp.]|nr:MAG: hypothetical protein KatS3mg039_1130 [Candidatus Kapabacteria bacterium]